MDSTGLQDTVHGLLILEETLGGKHMAHILLFSLLHVYILPLKMKAVNFDAYAVFWASIKLLSLHTVYN